MWPYLFQNNDIVIPTYLFINSIAFSIAIYWAYARAKERNFEVNQVLDLALAIMLGGFVGSRTFHILFEHPEIYFAHPNLIFKFWLGGFVYYGGMLGSLLLAFLLCRIRKYDFLKLADLVAPVLALGYAIGRTGCLAAGCCFGKATTVPWAIHFPPNVEAPPLIGIHPTQIYSSVWELIVLGILLRVEKNPSKVSGRVFGLWMVLHSLGRGVIEQFRDDFRGPMLLHLSISTWLSAAVLVFGIWLLRAPQSKKV